MKLQDMNEISRAIIRIKRRGRRGPRHELITQLETEQGLKRQVPNSLPEPFTAMRSRILHLMFYFLPGRV